MDNQPIPINIIQGIIKKDCYKLGIELFRKKSIFTGIGLDR